MWKRIDEEATRLASSLFLMPSSNRAILLTPPGPAAIAVIRLTGDATDDFLRRHFSRPAVAGRCVHGELSDGGRVIDDPVIVRHERGADISVHGGPWVVRSVLELARRGGFEIVQLSGGPLPLEAVDGDDDAERAMLALVQQARTKLALQWLLASDRRSPVPHWLLQPPTVAIIGPANAGKSTIANQLFAQERSITADVPGTTRDWVGEVADIDGLAVFLIDTPGLRETGDPIERAAIEQSQARVAKADLVVLVLDGTDSLQTQRQWAAKHPGALVVRNKCDREAEIAAVNESVPHVYTVATSGEGIGALRQAIVRNFVRGWKAKTQAGVTQATANAVMPCRASGERPGR
jgi:small GTP-binding protein